MVVVPRVELGLSPYKEPVLPLNYTTILGADERTRIPNFLFTREVHYQLCYVGIMVPEAELESACLVEGRRILSPLCLPISPLGDIWSPMTVPPSRLMVPSHAVYF